MNKVAWIIWTAFSSILFTFAALKHFLLGSSAWDLGIFEQFTWLISNGMSNEISSLRGLSPLQDHFSLILFPVSIVYSFFPSPYTLLFLQSAALGSIPAIIYSYYSNKQYEKQIANSLLFAIFLTPIIFLVNIANFHPEVLTTPLMLLALLYTNKKNRFLYLIFLLVSISAKKSQALFGVGLAFYAWQQGRRVRSLIAFNISILWWFVSSYYSSEGGDYIQGRLGYLGSDFGQIILTLLFKPWSIFSEAPPDTIALYIIGLLLPFLLLLRRSSIPALIGSLPILLTNIISNTGTQRELYSQYSIGILPFILVGCIDAYPNLITISSFKKSIYYPTILLTIISFVGYSRIGYYHYRYFPRLNQSIELLNIRNKVSNDDSILTTDHLAAQFAGRKFIHNIEDNVYIPLSRYDLFIFPKLKQVENQYERINSIIVSSNMKTHLCDYSKKHFIVCKKIREGT